MHTDDDKIKLRQVKPVFAGYISKAMNLLDPAVYPGDDAVHDVRVFLKKSRAVLKLIGSQLMEEYVQREYGNLREAGRIMAAWRDSSVLIKTLKSLRKEDPVIFSEIEDSRIKTLMEKPSGNVDPGMREEIARIREMLGKTGYRTRFEAMHFDPQKLFRELEKTYDTVRSAFMEARMDPAPKKIHKLRKRVKDFLYQLWFFKPLNPKEIRKLEKQLDSIAGDLGKYNDLTQLLNAIGYEYGQEGNEPSLDRLALLIREKQDQFLSEVWPVALRIFSPGRNLSGVLGFRMLVI